MDWLQNWLLGLVSAALLVSIAQSLAPEGALREALHFIGGLVLLLVLLTPLGGARIEEAFAALGSYEGEVEAAQREYEALRERSLAQSIEMRTGAYIEATASDLGVTLRAAVHADAEGKLRQATLCGPYSAALERVLLRELGLTKEEIIWKEGS